MFRQMLTSLISWLLVGAMMLLGSAAWAAAPWSRLSRQWNTQQQELNRLQKQRTTLRQRVKKIASQLQALKRKAKKGLFGLPARMKLSSVRAKAQVLGRKLERLERKLRRKQSRQKRTQTRMLAKIRKNLFALQMRWNRAKTKAEKARIRKGIVRWSSRARMLYPSLRKAARPTRRIKSPVVKLDPLDGPAEINQKVDALRDMEDRIRRRMLRLVRKIKKLRTQQKRDKKDRKLAQRVSDMTTEDDLFDEQGRNPRVAGGREKKAANNQATNKNTQNAGEPSTTPPQANQSPPPTDRNTGNEAARGPGMQPGGAFNNSNDGARNNTPRTLRPRVGVLPSQRAGLKNKDPMNPKGTLSQKLKALQRYQKMLRTRARKLQKQKRRFLKRARTIKRKERQRRAKKQQRR